MHLVMIGTNIMIVCCQSVRVVLFYYLYLCIRFYRCICIDDREGGGDHLWSENHH